MHKVLIGFLLFVGAIFGTNLVVVPRTQTFLAPLFGWAGQYAGLLFSTVIGFVVLIGFFAVANWAHLDAEIPEVG